MHIVDLLSRSFRPQFEQEILPAIHRTGRWQGSTYLIRQNGRRRLPVEITLTALGTNKSKKLTGLAITIRKKTKCTSVEIERRKSEERLKKLFDETVLGIYQTTPAGKILMVNKALYRMLGYRSAEELMKRNLECDGFELTYSRSRFKQELEKNDILTGLESAWKKADGSFIHVRENARVVRDEAGKILYYEGTVEDITERKRVEEALSSSEELFRATFENANVGVCIVSLDGHLLKVNEEMCRMFGYCREELEKMTVNSIAYPEDTNISTSFIKKALSEKTQHDRFDKRYIHKDGHIIWGHVSSSLVHDPHGKPLYFISHVQDITEHKRAEETLRQSEERLRKAQVIASLGNWEIDLKSKTFWGSDETFRIYGIERKTDFTSSDSFRAVVLPEHEQRLEKSLWNLIKEKKEYNEEFQIRRVSDGQIRHIHSKAELVCDQNGKPIKVNGVSQDITEYKKIEEARRLSEKQFYTLADQSPNMIFINVKGKVIYVNKACEEIVGYRSDEFYTPDFDFMTLIAPESAGIVQEAFRKHLKGEDIGSYEYTMITKDGSKKNVINSVRLIEYGGERAILGVVTDITARKQSEEALRDSEERYRRLVEFSPEPVIVHSEGIIVYANPATLTLIGAKKPSELIGRSVLEMVHPDYREFVKHRISSGITEGKTLPVVEEKFLTLDGSTIDVEVAALPIVFEGKPAMQVVVRDITGQKKLQAQLLQAQKMEAIGRLAGGVAHDYNNMIGVILGYASLLEKQIPHTDPSYLKVQSIITAANRTADLTRQLLAFARKQIATPMPLNLNDELIPLQKMIGRLIGEDITLKIRPQQDLWTIRLDPTQIAQILTNLATNARDAIKDTGTISIETSNITIEQNTLAFGGEIPPGEYAVLIFSDTGPGMDDTVKHQIFEPFFTTKSKEEGTGLGLSTVFGIVNQNNGFITLQSEPEQGTKFTIFFPRFYGEPETPAEIIEDTSLAGTETILVVEDVEELMNFVTTALEIYGYTILSANSPAAAFNICRGSGRTIDLLVTDVVMPDMNGKEFRNQLVALYPHIKAIFMSGYSADIVAHRGILEEGVNFLQKPFTQRTLALKVREVLDRQ
jgi:PAS domain S-box-containing protein